MEYNKTVNLPHTDFSMKAHLLEKEPNIQKMWESSKLYQLLLRENSKKDRYVLHDGPPYANGHIHMGQALNKVLKDIIVKYKSMEGFFAPFIPGWDCHGLPIEFQLLKELNKKKDQIDRVEFRKKAADFARKFIDIQREEFKRLGVLGDWENPYLTMSFEYEAQIIDTFKHLVMKGYIYQGKKPVYWCSHCETALAEAEVEYADHTSPSIYVKFYLQEKINELPAAALIWTTTPWTLPANLALCFNPEFEYSFVQYKTACGKEEVLLIAKDLVKDVLSKLGIEKYGEFPNVMGTSFENQQFKHPFLNRTSVGVLGSFVKKDEGTGIVHIAPGHGVEDYRTGRKYGLAILAPVDEKGRFTDEFSQLKGRDVFESNQSIVEIMKENGTLVGEEEISHSYPHCWRCKNPIVFRATKQWFLNVHKNRLRETMLDNIKQVTWIPPVGEHRISSMVETRPDWCLSRQRLWGVPIPIFYCKKCENPLMTEESIESVRRLVEKNGSDVWFISEPEDILPKKIQCEKCKGREFRKETDILDVWFDSGVSHDAVLKKREELSYPCDLYLEGSDQHRGWFQTSLIPSVALDGIPPYKTVLTHGFVVDGRGKKMSKSMGNVIAPQEIIEKYGADILRLWVASEDYREDVRVSEEIFKQLVDTYRKIRNTIRFILGNISDYEHSKHKVDYKDMKEVDQWTLHKLQIFARDIGESYRRFEFHNVMRGVQNFCIVDLSSFYMDILKDRLYTFEKDSRERRSCQTVLYEISSTLIRIIAPILSHTAEEAWSHFSKGGAGGEQSVFLSGFGSVKDDYINEDLDGRWQTIMDIRNLALFCLEKARADKQIGGSLEAKVFFQTGDSELRDFLARYKDIWREVLIVSAVEILPKGTHKVMTHITNYSITEELKTVSKKLICGVVKAPGEKCVRCWNYSEEVGRNNEHPKICERCLPVVEKFSK